MTPEKHEKDISGKLIETCLHQPGHCILSLFVSKSFCMFSGTRFTTKSLKAISNKTSEEVNYYSGPILAHL